MRAIRPRARRLAAAVLLLAAAVGCRSTIVASGLPPSDRPDGSGRIPTAAFFRDPLLSHMVLSPDGRHVAAVHSRNGAHSLMVRESVGGEFKPVAKLDETGLSVRRLGWPNNDELLATVEMRGGEAIGVRARQIRVFAVGRDGSDPRFLMPRWSFQKHSGFQHEIIDWLWSDPEHVLINHWDPYWEGEGLNFAGVYVSPSGERAPVRFRTPNGASARLLDVTSGRMKSVIYSRADVFEWLADHRGSVRAGQGLSRSGTNHRLYVRRRSQFEFAKVADYDAFHESGIRFAGFAPDPNLLYVWSENEQGRRSLFEFDLRTLKLGRMVYGHPRYDLSEIVLSKRDGRLLRVGYASERPELHFFDADAKREQIAIDRALKGTVNRIVSLDQAEKLAIVRAESDTVPPAWYLYDRDARQLEPLADAYPALGPDALAPVKPIKYLARDGLEIHGYLTLPREHEAANLPVIVLANDAPADRAVWGWNATVQFLASRGFAVLQVNTRGSWGYGREFAAAGHREWGRAMQADVADAVGWLIEQGVGDPERIGIYGKRYGGYVALEAAVDTPDLFRAVASYAGVADLAQLLADDTWYAFDDWDEPTVGAGFSDRDRLAAESPVHHVENIKAAVLLGHGTEDPVVHPKHAFAMEDALEDSGKEVETHLYEDEPHEFTDERNRVDFYEKLAAFFERHLEPCPAITPQALAMDAPWWQPSGPPVPEHCKASD
jgi:dipeptidyl aminopeptidase/acylaminoacyl peptidase